MESGQAALGGTWIITIIMVIVASLSIWSPRSALRLQDTYGLYRRDVNKKISGRGKG